LDQLRRGLRLDVGEDVAAVEAGIALMGIGRELIRVREAGRPKPPMIEVAREVVRFLASGQRLPLDRARHSAHDAAMTCLAELQRPKLGVANARAAAREMVAFTTISEELERCRDLLNEKAKGVPDNVA